MKSKKNICHASNTILNAVYVLTYLSIKSTKDYLSHMENYDECLICISLFNLHNEVIR
jgi:hypothetical protein